jgi:hypothetical protein
MASTRAPQPELSRSYNAASAPTNALTPSAAGSTSPAPSTARVRASHIACQRLEHDAGPRERRIRSIVAEIGQAQKDEPRMRRGECRRIETGGCQRCSGSIDDHHVDRVWLGEQRSRVRRLAKRLVGSQPISRERAPQSIFARMRCGLTESRATGWLTAHDLGAPQRELLPAIRRGQPTAVFEDAEVRERMHVRRSARPGEPSSPACPLASSGPPSGAPAPPKSDCGSDLASGQPAPRCGPPRRVPPDPRD